MRSPNSTRLVAIAALAVAAQLPASDVAQAHDAKDEKLPEPPVRMRVIAPSAQGPWMLRIDNESETKVRIPADVRLLTFEVRTPSDAPMRRTYAGGWSRRAAVCDGPKAFGLTGWFPARRELVLEPGHSYTEEFDPRLICFGKDAELLVPGARVKPYLGWKPRPKWSRKMEAAPFAADTASAPRRYRPLRRLEAPTLVLSHAPPVVYGPGGDERVPAANVTQGGAGEREKAGRAPWPPSQPPDSGPRLRQEPPGTEEQHARGRHKGKREPKSAEEASMHRPRRRRTAPRPDPPPQDDLGAHMTLTATHYADARRPTDIELSVQAHNTGERPVFVALRSRMLSFRVLGPNGEFRCQRPSVDHAVPRDLFQTLHHGEHMHMDVLLAEVCPPGAFDRQGLYFAIPELHADADGRQYGLSAITGLVTTRDPGDPSGTHQLEDDATLIRVTRGRRPFYRGRPRQIPTRVLPR